MSISIRRGLASAVKQPLRSSTASQWFRPLCSAYRPRPRQVPRVSHNIERTFATTFRLAQSFSQATAQRDELEDHADELQSGSQNEAPITKFADLGERNLVHPTIVDNLTRQMGLETLTEVQSLTLGESLKSGDM